MVWGVQELWGQQEVATGAMVVRQQQGVRVARVEMVPRLELRSLVLAVSCFWLAVEAVEAVVMLEP